MAMISSLRRKLSARQHDQGVTLQPKGTVYLQTDHKNENHILKTAALSLRHRKCPFFFTFPGKFSNYLLVGRFTAGFATLMLSFRGLDADLGEISFSELLCIMDISP